MSFEPRRGRRGKKSEAYPLGYVDDFFRSVTKSQAKAHFHSRNPIFQRFLRPTLHSLKENHVKPRFTIMSICLLTAAIISQAICAEVDITTLHKICDAYAEKWAGLILHYEDGDDFKSKCYKSISDRGGPEGIWAIRALLHDGHADFSVEPPMEESLIYPIVLDYDPISDALFIAAAFNDGYTKHIGRKIVLINGMPWKDVLSKRSAIEPQSTFEASLVLAARTITLQPGNKKYPDFPQELKLTFADKKRKGFGRMKLKSVLKKDEYALNKNGYPSIWGNIWNIEDTSLCRSPNELSKAFYHKGKRWLLWHPLSMNFDMANIDASFSCWQRLINDVDGVILDLSDTAGGGCEQAITIASIFRALDKMTLRYKTAGSNKVETFTVTPPPKTPIPWEGRVIMLTNGICGNGCEVLANIIAARKDVCTYGTQTAGRRIGTDSVQIDNVMVDIPTRDYLDSKGKSLEGHPFVPTNKGGGNFIDALNACR